ncbi:choice-of-anchor I family protein [Calothrix sp. FACHB-1219]|uniref:choice-of-anchor I family protein n=1 Tax=unclassified Calothrix TaxID=2619626 RepID=UPI001688C25C|nr:MULTISPECIES: choice-of-anchor I family protein [unclassified Calothrix]MBD2206544.1 choice-of-anchor I family protein [Calothrix sp. FACHB-168]MBD2221340.1 choice-of-anchor I family protein [Calothrix sp. FACHB-1219]
MTLNSGDTFGKNYNVLAKVGGFTSGNGAEISAFDPQSDRLFVVAANTVETYSLSNTGTVSLISALTPGFTLDEGTQAIPNSVAVSNGIVAVAYAIVNSTTNAQQTGKVSFYNAADGTFLNSVAVGALPDMLTFTPDGKKVLVANEGEPNSYGQGTSVDPEGSVSIIDLSGGVGNATVTNATFTSFNDKIDQLKAAGVRITGPGATVAQDLEPEYIAISGDGKTARITLQENNAIAVLDIASATITDILPLGRKDHSLPGNGLDASDRDSKINIQNWPVFGLYQPDAIASFTVNGQTYYITSNEGDARDYVGFSEEIRVGAGGYVLDPSIFPNAATLKQAANLGRLNVTRVTGDTDGDGDLDRIEAFGARSFSIWDGNGKQVFDSGDQLEQITATLVPSLFNSEGLVAGFDSRSDNKGPEPEGIVTGVINNRTYAFIGLERVGDVIVYDVTNPQQPTFVEYINTPEDIAVEGLTFISAADSPTGKPLLVTTNEVSKTVAVFEVTPPNHITGTSRNDRLRGTEGVDIIQGLAGRDSLSGGNGNDILYGGAGKDLLNGGNDDDILYGDEDHDTLLGGLGNDSLAGGIGSDRLEGGNGNDKLYGNDGRDNLIGGNGDDLLVGGKGKDTLTGGRGSDRFYLTVDTIGEYDKITDFKPTIDTIVISKAEFGLTQDIGTLDTSLFRLGKTATTESDRFIYDRNKGNLFFDADGIGGTAQIQIAQLSNKAALSSGDITVIA